jgi:hypothetical protein
MPGGLQDGIVSIRQNTSAYVSIPCMPGGLQDGILVMRERYRAQGIPPAPGGIGPPRPIPPNCEGIGGCGVGGGAPLRRT